MDDGDVSKVIPNQDHRNASLQLKVTSNLKISFWTGPRRIQPVPLDLYKGLY